MKVLVLMAATAALAGGPAQIAAEWQAHLPDRDAVFSTRQAIGADNMKAVADDLSLAAGAKGSGLIMACTLPQWYLELQPLVAFARSTPDNVVWKASWKRIDAALLARQAWHRDLLSGVSTDETYGFVVNRVASQVKQNNPLAREITRRVINDQIARVDAMVAAQKLDWAKGLADSDLTYVMAALTPETCTVDRDNTAWLKDVVAHQGWPRVSVVGEEAAGDAWLMVQHADQDVAFQKQVLALMVALMPAHEVRPDNYAYLYDRVARAEGRPQRYGTQGRCVGDGKWAPWEDEAPEGLDKRRADIGLGSEAEYETHFPFCKAPHPVT